MTSLRAFTTEDIPAHIETYRALYRTLSPSSLPITENSLTRAAENPNTVLAAYFSDNALVGIATLTIGDVANKSLGFIEGVVVADHVRGSGIGEALITFVLKEAQKRGVVSCQLTCNTSPERDTAHRLYRRMGFTVATRTTLYRKKL